AGRLVTSFHLNALAQITIGDGASHTYGLIQGLNNAASEKHGKQYGEQCGHHDHHNHPEYRALVHYGEVISGSASALYIDCPQAKQRTRHRISMAVDLTVHHLDGPPAVACLQTRNNLLLLAKILLLALLKTRERGLLIRRGDEVMIFRMQRLQTTANLLQLGHRRALSGIVALDRQAQG